MRPTVRTLKRRAWKRPARVFLGNRVVRNTGWILVSQLAGLGLQALQFLLVGHSLGASGFGSYAGAMAFVFLLVPFAGWGSGFVLLMKVARDRSAISLYWGNCLLITSVMGSALVIGAVVASHVVLPLIPLQIILCLALAELLFGAVVTAAGQAFQAVEALHYTGLAGVSLFAMRALAALLWARSSAPHDATTWSLWYLVATAVVATAVVLFTSRELGVPAPVPHVALANLRIGLYFSLSLQASNVYNDIDKVMLARYGALGAVGIYSAAYRVVTMAFAPISALVYSLFARFFQTGVTGIRGTAVLAMKMTPISTLYGVTVAVLLYVAAPLMPHLLGPSYAASVGAVRILSILPALKGIHYLAADALTGADRQRIRTMVQVGVAAFNVLINLWVIPRYSWTGAAWTSVASDACLALGLWLSIWYLWHRDGGVLETSESGSPAWGDA